MSPLTPKKIDIGEYIITGSPTVPTDILSLDLILGEGGFRKGDLIEISSESGVGKSTLVLQIVKNLLEKGMKCMYLDIERGVQEGILKNFGLLDKKGKEMGDDFLLLSPTTFTQVDEILKNIVQNDLIYDLIVIDSITAIIPGKLLDQPVDDIAPIGLDSRKAGELLRKYKPSFRSTGTSCILINQMRMKLDFGFGKTSKLESAGGHALKFYPDIRIRMQAGPRLKTH